MREDAQAAKVVQTTHPGAIDQQALEALLHKAVSDFGATLSSSMAVVSNSSACTRRLDVTAPLTRRDSLRSRARTSATYVTGW